MTLDGKTTPADHVGELLRRGPAPLPRGSLRARLRALVRGGLLRASQPQARYQREVDAALVGAVRALQDSLATVGERHAEQIERLEELGRELIHTSESLRRRIEDAQENAGWARRTLEPLQAELRAAPYTAEGFFEPVQSPMGRAWGFRPRARRDGIDAGRGSDYATFEDVFRGPASRVIETQRPYLELLADAAPVLDIGCGRGELLELLAEQDIPAEGVDADAGMVERCLAKGLQVSKADAIEHLASQADGSLGAIFSAQVIEHLPHEQLARLMSLARRKLRPGGLFIAETVNPHRIASMKTFWVDLTHQHPVFPEVALALCIIAGFDSGYVFAPSFPDFESARFESPAYAVVASVAAAEEDGPSSGEEPRQA